MATKTLTPHPPRATVAKTRRFIVEHELIARGSTVLAAVSGGPDSTCLLLILASLRRSLGFALHAAYFDHRLRGEQAARNEMSFVRSLCAALDVPMHTGAGDARGHAKQHHRSIEEAARELRYRFLARVASRYGCDAVATGHTRDDQTETVLLRVLRGSGLRGLAAMAPASNWPVASRAATPRLVRPLLALTRKETEACCRSAGVTPLRDPSNRSAAHVRNRIRHDLLPKLRRYNPRIDEALARLAGTAADDIALLEALASQAIGEARDGSISVSRRALAALPVSLQRHAVRLAVAKVLDDARGLSDRHVRAVLQANAGGAGTRLDLVRGMRLDVHRDALVLSRGRGSRAATPLPKRPTSLSVPGRALLGRWTVEARVLRGRPRDLRASNGRTAYVDADACGEVLSVRGWRPGDRFQPLGMTHPKKLQDFFVDAHVAREERAAVLLVTSERGIAWVAGQRPAEWAKVKPGTRRVLRLRAQLAGA